MLEAHFGECPIEKGPEQGGDVVGSQFSVLSSRTVAFLEGEKKMPNEIEKTDRSAKRSIPYKLLVATDKYYIVVSPSPNEKSLEIDRDSVAGMVVLR